MDDPGGPAPRSSPGRRALLARAELLLDLGGCIVGCDEDEGAAERADQRLAGLALLGDAALGVEVDGLEREDLLIRGDLAIQTGGWSAVSDRAEWRRRMDRLESFTTAHLARVVTAMERAIA